MREIEFRVWDNERTGAFTDILYQGDNALYEFFKEINDYEKQYGCKFVLMQYTGLKDKNGVKIFDGDILSIEATDDDGDIIQDILVIKYQEQGFYGAENMPLWDKQIWKYEIIGNIYQDSHLNPELIN